MDMGGSVVIFEIEGGKEVVFWVCNVFVFVDIFNNLGDVKFFIMYLVIIIY